jgi:hypothetical protein
VGVPVQILQRDKLGGGLHGAIVRGAGGHVAGCRGPATWHHAKQGVRRLAALLLASVVAGYPLVALVAGRSFGAAEVFGIAADPTMLAVLVFVAVWQSRWRWALAVVPLVWCLFSILTLHTMGSAQYLLVSGVALAGFGIMAMRRTSLA